MTQSFWESEVVEEHPQQSQNESQTEPVKLALSVDEFSALEERVLRAVDLLSLLLRFSFCARSISSGRNFVQHFSTYLRACSAVRAGVRRHIRVFG